MIKTRRAAAAFSLSSGFESHPRCGWELEGSVKKWRPQKKGR